MASLLLQVALCAALATAVTCAPISKCPRSTSHASWANLPIGKPEGWWCLTNTLEVVRSPVNFLAEAAVSVLEITSNHLFAFSCNAEAYQRSLLLQYLMSGLTRTGISETLIT